jgi:8-oxo-dGTP pyrophosphatase MutT (NUDIX family)
MQHMTLLYLINNQRILLALKKRGFGMGRWNGVGGKVEQNENIEAAAIRECIEEIGVTPHSLELVAEMNFNELHNGKRKQLHLTVFISREWTGKPVETEEMAPRWFSFKSIPYTKMWPADAIWLPLVVKGQKFSAEFELDDNDNVRMHSIVEQGEL